jgi:hypothetical protein
VETTTENPGPVEFSTLEGQTRREQSRSVYLTDTENPAKRLRDLSEGITFRHAMKVTLTGSPVGRTGTAGRETIPIRETSFPVDVTIRDYAPERKQFRRGAESHTMETDPEGNLPKGYPILSRTSVVTGAIRGLPWPRYGNGIIEGGVPGSCRQLPRDRQPGLEQSRQGWKTRVKSGSQPEQISGRTDLPGPGNEPVREQSLEGDKPGSG